MTLGVFRAFRSNLCRWEAAEDFHCNHARGHIASFCTCLPERSPRSEGYLQLVGGGTPTKGTSEVLGAKDPSLLVCFTRAANKLHSQHKIKNHEKALICPLSNPVFTYNVNKAQLIFANKKDLPSFNFKDGKTTVLLTNDEG